MVLRRACGQPIVALGLTEPCMPAAPLTRRAAFGRRWMASALSFLQALDYCLALGTQPGPTPAGSSKSGLVAAAVTCVAYLRVMGTRTK